ncbi:MAG: pantetheine-phosphate adenylyltransferase [Candidatus Cloacimonetes bacterium]|nr:pantetheine-phosphate adenylyltransferase [Candidatus Cloacimonadota bacterium]
MKIAIYPGTFDPITNGHIDILKKATKIFDEVILAVASETGKDTIFSLDEREEICKVVTSSIKGIKIMKFDGLVVEFAKKMGAVTMIRGLRAISDFEYELSQALMNKKLYEKIETIFFVPDNKYLYLSSTMVRQVIKLGGSIKDLIPDCVEEALIKKMKYKKI